MKTDQADLRNIVGRALSGRGAHVATSSVFSGVDAATAGTQLENLPHSLFQLLGHICFWQDWVLQWLDGGKPSVPEHAAGSWPVSPAPTDETDWQESVRRFQNGLEALERHAREADLLTKRGKESPLEMLQAIASHNSYHIGQAVILRQMLGKWPPPSGGLTW